jgi:hypothetical protein
MDKSAEVLTNDPREPVVQLVVKGPVDRFAAINPRMLNLRGNVGEALEGTVVIVPDEKYPFKVVSVAAKEGKNIRVALSETREGGRAAYTLVVKNTKAEAGSYSDTVVLKTDSKLQPELDVRVYTYLRSQPPAEKKAN